MAQVIVPINEYTNGAAPGTDWTNPITRSGTTLTVAGTAPNKSLDLFSNVAGTKVYGYVPVAGVNDIEGLVKFKYSSDFGKQGILALRYSGSSEATTAGYTMSASFISSAGQLAIDEGQFGYLYWGAWNYLANVTYWARFRVVGSQQYAKVWTDGSPEPAGWTTSGTDTHQTTGSFSGLTTYSINNTTSATVQYYYLSFGTNGDVAPYPPTFVQGTSAVTTSSTTCAVTMSVTAGNLIVLNVLGGGFSTLTSVTDTAGNSYTDVTANNSGSTAYSHLWYAVAKTTGSITITQTGNSANRGLVAQEYTNISNAVPDRIISATGTSTTASSGATAATVASPELVIGMGMWSSATASLGAGFANLNQVNSGSGVFGALESKVAVGLAAQTSTFGLSASNNWYATTVTFKSSIPYVSKPAFFGVF
jgi:hypothetical protein